MSPAKKPSTSAKTPNPATAPKGDPYAHEGAAEQDAPGQKGNTSLSGQMGHRNKPESLDTLDTDFPEPGENPEHSGER
ncbi:MAG TPA: hypothetical protein VFY05_03360 [Candidatus Angelobacter sp.]|nr:hypothetical protein [Candidatus Angelobacter sp.]